MGQTFTDDVFAGGHVASTDLQNIENNFATLKSMFSGTSQPSNAVAGMPWFDTTKKVMKQRNTANDGWLGLMHGDVNQKMWVYRNTAMDGWAVDSTPTDRVLAIKGGSTYTTGGAGAGTWTTASHSHAKGTLAAAAHNHQWYQDADGAQTWQSDGETTTAGYVNHSQTWFVSALQGELTNTAGLALYTKNTTTTITGSTATDGGTSTWRPAASVGTLQYLDL